MALSYNYIITEDILRDKINLLFEAYKYRISTYHFNMGHINLVWPNFEI